MGDRRLHPDDLESIRCIVEANTETKGRRRVPYAVRAALKFVAGSFVAGAFAGAGGLLAAAGAAALRAFWTHLRETEET
jgi:hypothetical protein